MAHYIISVGHTASGNQGCGAVDIIDESNCTREIAPIVANLLRENGHEVTFLQVDKSNSYNCEDCFVRAQQANAAGGDLFVEIHINAGGGTGSEVVVCKSAGGNTLAVAGRVTNAISTAMGFPNRGVKVENLIVLNKTSMPAILVECLFCDSSDAYIYDANKLANAIVSGLLDTKVESTKYKVGWNQNNVGWWYSTDGTSFYVDCWQKIEGYWYYFDLRGYALQKKWLFDKTDGKWYYFNNSCQMQRSQWILWNDLWYYVGLHGDMLTSQFINDSNGKSYYVDEDGVMLAGCTVQGKQLGPDGAVIVK